MIATRPGTANFPPKSRELTSLYYTGCPLTTRSLTPTTFERLSRVFCHTSFGTCCNPNTISHSFCGSGGLQDADFRTCTLSNPQALITSFLFLFLLIAVFNFIIHNFNYIFIYVENSTCSQYL